MPFGMSVIGPDKQLKEKKDQNDPTQMSKLFKRAETLKKIHRQRTAKFSNEDLLSDDDLVMIEKIE